MSVVVHEFAHGYMAYRYGDTTAYLQGRLTLNPLKHLDLFGSILLPLLLIVSNAGFVLGWARPVPFNPDNLRDRKKGIFWISISGILANLLIALVFGLLIRVAPFIGLPSFDPLAEHPFYAIASAIMQVNLLLAIFNIIPIPPLDGARVLFNLLPARFRAIEAFLEQWGMFVLLFFIIFLWKFFAPAVFWLFTILSGIH